TCAEAVEKALDLGYRHVDTAQRYKNESQVGRGIERSDVERDEVFLTTKIWRSNMEYEDVIDSTEESLKKLRTDYVDLLLIHWPSRSVPLEETLDAMNQLVDEGKVRNIGVSNFDVDQLKKASRLSEAPVLTDQVQYHPFKSQEELLSYCQREGVILTAYSPLGHGGTTA
ncbi:MAG: aldo/keto reductase, partial [Halobacteria archaeon]|nr:aldo/keto reductase [Halobacteria archaeon]